MDQKKQLQNGLLLCLWFTDKVMPTNVQILKLDRPYETEVETFASEVVTGLNQNPRTLPSRYIYDDEGSRLFEEIMTLPEYYPTQCEQEILEKQKGLIVKNIEKVPIRVVELGSGDGVKTRILLQELLAQGYKVQYVPIDVSDSIVLELVENLNLEVEIVGVVGDYYSALSWLLNQPSMRNLLLFLGSSIGNFTRKETHIFLEEVKKALQPRDYLFIGFDLRKEIATIEQAYNDSRGITRRFCMNILKRINKGLGGNFNLDHFEYLNFYNPGPGRIESWLMSKKAQTVHLALINHTFEFQAWEGILVEYSYKYSLEQLQHLTQHLGLEFVEHYFDHKGYYTDVLWRLP